MTNEPDGIIRFYWDNKYFDITRLIVLSALSSSHILDNKTVAGLQTMCPRTLPSDPTDFMTFINQD